MICNNFHSVYACAHNSLTAGAPWALRRLKLPSTWPRGWIEHSKVLANIFNTYGHNLTIYVFQCLTNVPTASDLYIWSVFIFHVGEIRWLTIYRHHFMPHSCSIVAACGTWYSPRRDVDTVIFYLTTAVSNLAVKQATVRVRISINSSCCIYNKRACPFLCHIKHTSAKIVYEVDVLSHILPETIHIYLL